MAVSALTLKEDIPVYLYIVSKGAGSDELLATKNPEAGDTIFYKFRISFNFDENFLSVDPIVCLPIDEEDEEPDGDCDEALDPYESDDLISLD